MKTGRSFHILHPWFGLLSLGFLAGAVRLPAGELSQPVITSIRLDASNVVVTANVPSGVLLATLEGRQRLGAGSWEPRALIRTDGGGGVLTFRLPRSRQLEVLRVRGDATEPLPASFYSGTNSFLGQPASSGGPGAVGLVNVPGRVDPTQTPAGNAPRAVAESDIWKIRGPTLYFFNQYRGLQIIDLTDPDAASVRGAIELPAAGEQMYLLGEPYVALLAQPGCGGNGDESQVLVVADNGPAPSIDARLPVPGFIQESRMVGSALYVASQSFRPVAGSNTWEWGTLVSSFDLADPGAPVKRGTLWYAGYGNVVTANDTFLFVGTQDPSNWWQSLVQIIDITAPDGTMAAFGTIRTAGRVLDKFKLNYSDGVFTSISEDWHWNNGTRLVTDLETFRLPDPRSASPVGIIRLGGLQLGAGEQLHATRFDSNRVYVVTFFRIDPLWVVDLSDPAAPRIAGSVNVPGWSTFIEPLADRLVTLGVESNRVAVSLFDVQDAARPSLLSRVLLGENYSWSDANWDEKAFTVLPDAGLILVPYTGYTTNGYAERVQLIDLNPDSLAARGIIQRPFAFRRSTLYTDRILAISGRELVSVDATDRDYPLVRGQTELAWPVDRLLLHGNYLIEVSDGGWSWGWGFGSQDNPVLRVTAAGDPNFVLGLLTLSNLPVQGVSQRGDRLYIAQAPGGWFFPFLAAGGGAGDTNAPPLLFTVIDLGNLPALPLLGQTTANIDAANWLGELQPVWPKADLLVWSGGGNNFWWWWRGAPVAGLAAPAGIIPWPPFWGGGGGELIAFDVSDSTAPQFASEVNLASSNWWSFSRAFTADGLVYLSHETSEFFPWLDSPWQTSVASADTNVVVSGTWVQRDFLDVVDYADARQPTLRDPVNIPGTLEGISRGGALLYTVGPRWTTNWWSDWTEILTASAYDGVSAHLVDSLALPPTWPHPVLVDETNVFIGRSGTNWWSTDASPSYLETWILSDAGHFTQLGSATLAMPASTLAEFSGLLAAQETDNNVALFDHADPAALRVVGQGKPSGCSWFDLSHADGALGRGLWIPLGAFGVATIPALP